MRTAVKQRNKVDLGVLVCRLVAFVIVCSLVVTACTKAPESSRVSTSQSSENTASTGATPVSPDSSSSRPANESYVSPSVAAPATPSSNPDSLPPPPPPPVRTDTTGTDYGALITKSACSMALTLDDMGQGWARMGVGSQSLVYATSVCQADYKQGGYYAPIVENTVAVYRTVGAASNVWDQEKATSKPRSSATIGDECFINNSNAVNKQLVFRKNNVVVWIIMKNYQSGDLESFARIVESRISP